MTGFPLQNILPLSQIKCPHFASKFWATRWIQKYKIFWDSKRPDLQLPRSTLSPPPKWTPNLFPHASKSASHGSNESIGWHFFGEPTPHAATLRVTHYPPKPASLYVSERQGLMFYRRYFHYAFAFRLSPEMRVPGKPWDFPDFPGRVTVIQCTVTFCLFTRLNCFFVCSFYTYK